MAIKTTVQRIMAILALISILAFGQMLFVSPMGYTVNAEETDDNAGASEDAGDDGEWDYLLGYHYENLPFEPVVRESNNVLLGAGLVVALAAVGGAIVVDRRKQN